MATSDLPVQVHRLGLGRVLAYVWFGCVGLAALDVVRKGLAGADAGWLIGILATAALGYIFGIRPQVVENPTGLTIHNPLRTARVPWASITEVDVTDVLRVQAGPLIVRCFAVPFSRPGRGNRATGSISGLTPLPANEVDPSEANKPQSGRAPRLAERLTELAANAGPASDAGPAEQSWALDGAGLMLLVVLAFLAVLVLA